MNNMSFSLTTDQVRDRSKNVTRRIGWWNLKPGDLVRACKKCMGLRKGEKVEELAIIRVVSVRAEPLRAMLDDRNYGLDEVAREGFKEDRFLCWPSTWVPWFCQTHKCTPDTIVNRIEFEYVKPKQENP